MAASGSHSTSSSSTALIQQLDSKSRDLIAKIVAHLKSQGNFDELRRDCLEELDKMEAFRQLNQRVESYVATFLSKQEWSESLSKNQIRDNLRKHVCASDALKSGSQRLVSQVLERKSKSFQTRLEGVVQNYIYMESGKDKKARYQSYRSEPERSTKASDNKTELEKTSVTGKSSTISDINDIISQIPGTKENASTSKGDGNAHSKSESRESPHSSTSTHHRTDSSLPKQHVSGSHLKNEHGKLERKGDLSVKKVNTSKRVIPKITGSQNTGTPSEKNAESSINSKTRAIHNKPSHSPKGHSPKVESPRDTTDVEKPNKPENMVASLKSDAHRTSPSSNASKSSHVTTDKTKHSEVKSGLHSRQKLEEEYAESTRLIPDSKKPVDMEQKEEEKTFLETQTKKESHEKSDKSCEDSKPTETESLVLSGGDSNKDTAIKESLPEDSESDTESDVSDVSSVHTSDLSSFDGEVSSDSNHSDDEDTKRKTKGGTNDSEGKSKRKDKESIGNGKSKSAEGRKGNDARKLSKGSRMQKQTNRSGTGTAETTTKRKRGRPRKDHSTSSDTQNERGDLKQQESRQQQAESSDGMPARDRSKRPIKKRRCYSPSSEGSREVCLPSKRSRVSSKD